MQRGSGICSSLLFLYNRALLYLTLDNFLLPGWQGTLCHVKIDHCQSSPCLNGATCLNSNGGFVCVCQDGYNGMTAFQQIVSVYWYCFSVMEFIFICRVMNEIISCIASWCRCNFSSPYLEVINPPQSNHIIIKAPFVIIDTLKW